VFDETPSTVTDLLGRTLRLWWRELLPLVLLNILWFAFQLPIITAPIATAVVYAVARKVVDDEFVSAADAWHALRMVAVPALLWGALNLAIGFVVIGNFWAYRTEVGLIWALFRVTWAAVGLGWFIVNLFYWPFWLAAERPGLWSTLRNSALFVLRRPVFGFGVGLLSMAIFVGSLLLTLPFVAAAMTWVALLGLLAVDTELQTIREDSHDRRGR
jgi:hypothetical protein